MRHVVVIMQDLQQADIGNIEIFCSSSCATFDAKGLSNFICFI